MSWRKVVKKVVPNTIFRGVVDTVNRALAPKIGASAHTLSAADRQTFGPVLDVWRPADDKPVVLMRWVITEWCNYACHYCPQDHDRHAPFGDGYTAHAFDNHSLKKWQAAFQRHFTDRRLSMVITGGEPFLDRRNMVGMLETLTQLDTLEWVRIDTNATFDPKFYDHINKDRLVLMCTYHPGQTEEAAFFERVNRLRDHGFKIEMINYVATHENMQNYPPLRDHFRQQGIALHPNPLWASDGYYSKADLEFLRQELPETDYGYRTGLDSPLGKSCLYPTLAYQMDSRGHMNTGCFANNPFNFFDTEFPKLLQGPVPCPAKKCTCTDMYSFLAEVNRNTATNPIRIYSEALLRRK